MMEGTGLTKLLYLDKGNLALNSLYMLKFCAATENGKLFTNINDGNKENRLIQEPSI